MRFGGGDGGEQSLTILWGFVWFVLSLEQSGQEQTLPFSKLSIKSFMVWSAQCQSEGQYNFDLEVSFVSTKVEGRVSVLVFEDDWGF